MDLSGLFAAARASHQERTTPVRSSPYVAAKITIETNNVHFLAPVGKQRGMMFKGPAFRNFMSTLKGNPDTAQLFDREGDLGLLTNGHRLSWGKPDERPPYVNVWGFLQEPTNESKIMGQILVRILKNMITKCRITSKDPEITMLLQQADIHVTPSNGPQSELGEPKYAWPPMDVAFQHFEDDLPSIVILREYSRFRQAIENLGYNKVQISTGTGEIKP